MRGRRLRDFVTLSSQDGPAVTYSPSTVPASIRPSVASTEDERRRQHTALIRYHAQVTTNTRLTWTGKQGESHTGFVRGIEDVDNRHREMVLLVEEVLTP